MEETKLKISLKAHVDKLLSLLKSAGIKSSYAYKNNNTKTDFDFKSAEDFDKAIKICDENNIPYHRPDGDTISISMSDVEVESLINRKL